MRKTILGLAAFAALLIPHDASAAAPNGMPNATVEQLTTLAFSLGAMRPGDPPTTSNTSVGECRQRDEGGWRCLATFRWKLTGSSTWAGRCDDIRLIVWNTGGYANAADVAACPGIVRADTTPRR